jgi:ADP-ribose pyrophosphatase YjhB (NUDIX family)
MSRATDLFASLNEMHGQLCGAGILFKHANEIFLVKNKDKGLWCVPGGMAEPKDLTPKDTAVREFREELGMFPGYAETHKTIVTKNKEGISYVTILMESDTRFEPAKLDENEIEMCKWFNIEDLPKDILPECKMAIDAFGFKTAAPSAGMKDDKSK